MELTPKEKIIKDFLIKCAKNEKTITYQNLCIVAKLGLDMNNPNDRTAIGKLLCNVAKSELQEQSNKPILSVVVITANDKKQGEGFYKLCEELGYGKWQELMQDEDFAKERMNECYTFYSQLKK